MYNNTKKLKRVNSCCQYHDLSESCPRYHHHRAVDNAHGVITAMETTSGSIAENKRLMSLVEQHEQNVGEPVQTVVADSKYGTVENFVKCQHQINMLFDVFVSRFDSIARLVVSFLSESQQVDGLGWMIRVPV